MELKMTKDNRLSKNKQPPDFVRAIFSPSLLKLRQVSALALH